jgi:diaminohydroxyphosphoribosylaminopyrimidine deaminase/5-amino-6-(5-phosphoribosylamino)uracil reductase
MQSTLNDEYWMAKALRLAEKGQRTTTPNPNVGCVIVKDGKLIGSGFHKKAGTPHAEVYALAEAGNNAEGATAYVTLEPCAHFGKTPPCAEALVNAKVARVVCAMKDPNPLVAGKGLSILERAGISTRSGVLESQAEQVNRGFLKRMRTGQPWVVLKMASSLDGGTALKNGESQWITGPHAREDVQQGRATSSAVVTGIGSMLADNPSMNVRLDDCERQPDRLILDTQASTPTNSKMAQLPGRSIVLHSESLGSEALTPLINAGFETTGLPTTPSGRLQLVSFMKWAGEQGYNSLWLECGATLAGAFLQENLVDEVILYQAPKFIGSNTQPVAALQLDSLKNALEFEVDDVRFVGQDIRWTLLPKST